MSGSIPQLTIVALAWNEARHLGPCFESARPLVDAARASTMVLLDAAADEATRRAARHVAGRVVESRFVNFSKQRNRALDEVDGDWVFFIDPDERLTPALCDEIARRIAQPECNAWRVARRNIFFGREV